MTNIIQTPALNINKILYKGDIPPHIRREQRIVANLIHYMQANGWSVYEVFDGEEFTPVGTMKEAMEIIFNLDEALLYFRKGIDPSSQFGHNATLILGNDLDIICDWTYSKGDADGFNALMSAFNTEDYA